MRNCYIIEAKKKIAENDANISDIKKEVVDWCSLERQSGFSLA